MTSGEEQRQQEQRRGHNVGEAGAAAGGDAGCALDVGRHGRRAERRADHRADRVGQQRLPGARQRAVRSRPAWLAHADERADRIEQREEEEDRG